MPKSPNFKDRFLSPDAGDLIFAGRGSPTPSEMFAYRVVRPLLSKHADGVGAPQEYFHFSNSFQS